MIQNEESVLVSRRSVLLGAAGAGLLTLAGPALRADATSAYPGMPTSAQVWNWQHQLVDFGTRYTGSPGHVRFVDWLAQQFAAVPGFQLHTDRLTFNRWLAHDYSLRLTQPSSVGRPARSR
jgi:hypothetical protein